MSTDERFADDVRHVDVAGHRVAVSVRRRGDCSRPLLLLHGIGAEHERWGRFRTRLDRTTVAFDVRAEHLGRRPSVRTYARFVADVLTALDLSCVDVLGLSWGGIVTQQLAHDHPQRVRRFVLVSTTPGFMSVPARPAAFRAIMQPKRDAPHMTQVIQEVYGGDLVDNPGLANELGLVRPIDEVAYRRQLLALLGWTSVPWLTSIRREALILHADDDPVAPYANSVLMQRLLRRSRLETIKGGGHLFVLTRPEETARLVDAFLDRPDPS